MEFKDYVRILRAHWAGVLALVLCGVMAAAIYNVRQPKVYEAHATGFVSSGQTPDAGTAQMMNTLAQSRVTSYVSVATSTVVAQRVLRDPSIKGLGLPTTPSGIASLISVSQPPETVTINISARAGSPATAATLANAWVAGLSKEIAKQDGPATSASSGSTGQQTSSGGQIPTPTGTAIGLHMEQYGQAELPSAPVLPRTKVDLAVGFLLGGLLGFAYAMVRHQLDRRLRSTEEVERQFKVSVIGAIPQTQKLHTEGNTLMALPTTSSAAVRSGGAAEGFRKLRTNLAFMDVDNPPRVIVVTSPKQGDGKSTISANLAATIAVGGQRVVLLDGDLRRPTVADSLGLVDGAGLTDVLLGRVTAAEVLQTHPDVPRLQVLASGMIPPNPSELLGSQAMRSLVRDLAGDAIVIIDAPPLLPVTDAAVLSRWADGAIVVVTHGGTLDSELAASLASIEQVHGRVLGVVFNRMRRGAGGGYYGGHYYRYEYRSEGRRKRKPARSSSASHTTPSQPASSGSGGARRRALRPAKPEVSGPPAEPALPRST